MLKDSEIKIQKDKDDMCRDDIILDIMGGIGNQMFQYAMYLRLKNCGKNVKLAITNKWQWDFPFELDIFPNVKYEEVKYDQYHKRVEAFHNRTFVEKVLNRIFPSTKDIYYENEKIGYNEKILYLQDKIVIGYFQDLKYIAPIENEIKTAFIFPDVEDAVLKYSEIVEKQKYVSVHIRRGDYLKYPKIYGGICDQSYYDKAMEYFLKQGYSRFAFFSNDMPWVKDHFMLPDAIYFTPESYETYHDWYDIYIMSHCAHNIIANSTFSWWGAWLNKNKDHIVIAPKKWLNTQKNKNICPSEWIRI